MIKLLFTAFLLITAISISFSQIEIKHCGADEMRIATLKQNPKIANAVIKRDANLEAFTQNFVKKHNYNNSTQKTNTSTATYIIPVVFHVIHNYGIENIADAQIKDGLEMLNKTFRKLRPDTASMVAAFKPIHADCDIEFKLASKDPQGNCHSGINRIASSLTTSGDHRVKNLIHWNPSMYLNVYIVSNAAGLAGHCVWPSDADTIPLWDGIVIGYNYVGTYGTSNLTQSVAFAHECGHYLNLHHIWGGNNVPNFYYYPCANAAKDCNIDDLVADTPPTIGWQSCNLTGASCGNVVDNVQNAMDYSYCNVMFTQGQKTRMQACLNSTVASRSNLWQQSNLIATGVNTIATLCKADFTSNKKVICANNQVVFSNTSFNGNYTSLTWNFPGGNPSTSSIANPTVNYNTAGLYNVELKVKNGNDSVTTLKQNYITAQTLVGTSALPYTESFETTNDLLNLNWFTNNIDTSKTWELTNLASYTGLKSVTINNFNETINGKDELLSGPINLTGASNLSISFKYAFARRDTSNKDQLQLFCLQNCGSTNISKFSAIGATLETTTITTTNFYPTSQSQWKTVSATLQSIFITSGFRFKFLFTGKGGNNIFIDDINIDVSTGINTINEQISAFNLFPNPSTGISFVNFNLNQPKTLFIKITNTLGQIVYSNQKQIYNQGKNNIKINTSQLNNGLYFIELTDGQQALKKQLQIIN